MKLETLKENLETLKKDADKIKRLTNGNRPFKDGYLMSGIQNLENIIERKENAEQ